MNYFETIAAGVVCGRKSAATAQEECGHPVGERVVPVDTHGAGGGWKQRVHDQGGSEQ